MSQMKVMDSLLNFVEGYSIIFNAELFDGKETPTTTTKGTVQKVKGEKYYETAPNVMKIIKKS